MVGSRDTLFVRIWFLIVAVLIATNVILLMLRVAHPDSLPSHSPIKFVNISYNSSAVTVPLATVAHTVVVGTDAIGHAFGISATALVQVADKSAHFFDEVFSFRVADLIQPQISASVPVIEPVATVSAAPAVLAAASPAPPPVVSIATAQWPIHGRITLPFGVSDWPFETVHTGIDISDGKPQGTTPILPFKPGRVIQVVHGNTGLGNHIVVDNGSGITSIYGHLYSTAVGEGQEIFENTVLGYEGTTGASTGPHLHFEIRINGVPVNPLNYVNGLP